MTDEQNNSPFFAGETEKFPAPPSAPTASRGAWGKTKKSKPESEGTAPSFWSRKSTKITAIVVAAILGLIVVLCGVDYALARNKIHYGVSIDKIDVGGMSKPAAEKKISEVLSKDLENTVPVSSGEHRWDTTSDMVGASYDAEKLVSDAFKVGKEDSFITAVGNRFKAWFGGVKVPVAFNYDPLLFNPYLEVVSAETVTPPVQSSVEIEGTDATVVPGNNGTRVDEKALQKGLTEGFLRSKACELPIVEAPMNITPEIAEKGAEVARVMISAPFVATYEDKKWDFSGAEAGEWVSFETTNAADGWQYNPYIDPEKTTDAVRKEIGVLGVAPKNATFQVSGDGITIIPSENGTGVNVPQMASDLTTALKSTDPATRVVTLQIDTLAPERTTADAEAMGITQKIASYTTNYTTGAANRNKNIHLMADELNNSLVAPGGIWSFWDTAGNTTADKGYVGAGAIVDGEVVDELGGGICQVATTVFNAVYESGFPVVERSPHSLYMSNYPTGRDAAVSWSSPDLRWKNDSDHWVLVTTSWTASSVTVTLWGTDPGYSIATETGPWTNPTSLPEKTVEDPNLPAGTTNVKQGGAQGKSVVVTRTVSKNGAVIRTDTFKSTYKPQARIVVVGTKPAESVPAQ